MRQPRRSLLYLSNSGRFDRRNHIFPSGCPRRCGRSAAGQAARGHSLQDVRTRRVRTPRHWRRSLGVREPTLETWQLQVWFVAIRRNFVYPLGDVLSIRARDQTVRRNAGLGLVQSCDETRQQLAVRQHGLLASWRHGKWLQGFLAFRGWQGTSNQPQNSNPRIWFVESTHPKFVNQNS